MKKRSFGGASRVIPRGFCLFFPSAFKVNHRFNHRNPVQEVGMMVAIGSQ
jgi:hypothetical protein